MSAGPLHHTSISSIRSRTICPILDVTVEQLEGATTEYSYHTCRRGGVANILGPLGFLFVMLLPIAVTSRRKISTLQSGEENSNLVFLVCSYLTFFTVGICLPFYFITTSMHMKDCIAVANVFVINSVRFFGDSGTRVYRVVKSNTQPANVANNKRSVHIAFGRTQLDLN